LAREALISLAQAVYDSAAHPATDGVAPSPTDAKRMLEAYVAATLSGSGNEEARRMVRSAISLADALQHRRSATQVDAELVVVATESVVRLVEAFSGIPGPSQPWEGVEHDGRYFAWAGPALHALEDRPPVPTPARLTDTLRDSGMTPSFGLRTRLNHHLAKGGHQVFETDRRRWRRELSNTGDGDQVLLGKGSVDGVEELDTKTSPTLFVPASCGAVLGLGLLFEPKGWIQALRRSASARRRTSSQGIAADSPASTRRALFSTSAAHAASISAGSVSQSSRLARSSAATSARSSAGSASASRRRACARSVICSF